MKTTTHLPRDQGWTGGSMTELIEYLIAQYHEPLREELPRLVALAAKVSLSDGSLGEQLNVLDSVVGTLCRDIDAHLQKEERVLFPWIRSGGPQVVVGVRLMTHEQSDICDQLSQLRELAGKVAASAASTTTWRALWRGIVALDAALRELFQLEYDVLFPQALAA